MQATTEHGKQPVAFKHLHRNGTRQNVVIPTPLDSWMVKAAISIDPAMRQTNISQNNAPMVSNPVQMFWHCFGLHLCISCMCTNVTGDQTLNQFSPNLCGKASVSSLDRLGPAAGVPFRTHNQNQPNNINSAKFEHLRIRLGSIRLSLRKFNMQQNESFATKLCTSFRQATFQPPSQDFELKIDWIQTRGISWGTLQHQCDMFIALQATTSFDGKVQKQ